MRKLYFSLTLLACGPGASSNGDGRSEVATGANMSSTNGASSEASDDTAAQSEASSGGDAAASCSCLVPVDETNKHCDEVLAAVSCSPERLCDHVTLDCPHTNADMYVCTHELVYGEAALHCALTALRDGTPGYVSLAHESSDGYYNQPFGYAQPYEDIRILDGRAFASSSCQDSDTGTMWHEHSVGTLADSNYFAGCLALPAPAEQYRCLFDGLVAPQQMPACAQG